MLKISDLSYDWKLSDIDKVQKNKLKVFSFFAGAGGSSMGYKLAGCDPLIASKNKSSSTCSACPSLNFFFLPLFSSAIIFAPQNKVQGAEASKISKLNNSLGMSSLLKNSLMSSQKAYFGGVNAYVYNEAWGKGAEETLIHNDIIIHLMNAYDNWINYLERKEENYEQWKFFQFWYIICNDTDKSCKATSSAASWVF
jgi:hypothetical protein